VSEPAADSDASIVMSIANVAQAVEPQRRQLLHRPIMGVGPRNDCRVRWVEGLRRPVIGNDSAQGSDCLSDPGQLFFDLRNHIASLFAAFSAETL
jgi:hypothetical protein